ncbi:MAG: aminomethyl-transferring glycine dehydrogenase subunit GcvPA [Planctomycetota bacterium]
MAYFPHTDQDRDDMLEALGLDSIEELFSCIPEKIRLGRNLDLPKLASEPEIIKEMGSMAARNARMDNRPSFLGAGSYLRFIPAAIDSLSSRGEFNTAYTPYQAEVSQGTLQAIMEYQTMLCQLTGMEISNASMYDAGTALAEAVFMAYAVRRKGNKVLVSEAVHPEYRRVLDTYLADHPIEAITIGLENDLTALDSVARSLEENGDDVLAVVLQNPNFFGLIEPMENAGSLLGCGRGEDDAPRRDRPLLISIVDPISLGILKDPGAYGADIAIGDGQQLGNPPNLGGPTFGFFTTLQEHVRKVPGRIVGETVDSDGKRGYVLTFQTREQHIRRERATSNICTNQGLCSLRGAMYMAFLGPEGIRKVAETSARLANYAHGVLTKIEGVEATSTAAFFQEFSLRLPAKAETVYRTLAERNIGGGLPLGRYFPGREDEMLFAFTELSTKEDIDTLAAELGLVFSKDLREANA